MYRYINITLLDQTSPSLSKCVKYEHMVNISQRIQFVGKQNKVLLSEFVDINHMFIFYAFTQ